MGWFETQIEERRNADRQLLENSFVKVAGVVVGRQSAERILDERIITKNAIDEILKAYHLKPVEPPETVVGPREQLDHCLRRYGLMRRSVELTEGWYQEVYGPMLGYLAENGLPVALLQDRFDGYYFLDPQTKARVRLSAKTAGLLLPEAVCFYRPLPQKPLGIQDLLLYIKRCATGRDMLWIVCSGLLVTLSGLFIPQLIRALTGPVLQSGSPTALAGAGICLLCTVLAVQLLRVVYTFAVKGLEIKTSLGLQASLMMRLLSLPASFFRDFSPGELKSRVMSVSAICSLLLGVVMSATLGALFALMYLPQILRFAPALVLPSLTAIVLTFAITAGATYVQSRINRRQLALAAKESGLRYALLSGVQKIKLAGAETRVFAKWLDLYADGAELIYDPPTLVKVSSVFTLAVSLLSNIALYGLAVQSGTTSAAWFAFSAAYGALMGAFTTLADTAASAAKIRPILENAEPVLQAVPETDKDQELVTGLSGRIELDHVSFRYSKQTPYILEDLSLRIQPGDYVAIVGKTGCGKSTLIRLLLGFETPEQGAVYYDGKDLCGLDHASVRRHIGTVMQDADLFEGDIYSNIVLSAPELDREAAWQAAELAGIADDIRALPMGMHTHVGPAQGGLSGGQKQRILIARAIAPKPKILIFDEATSALDNHTQRTIAQALDRMDCTRIVLAHRLSTVRQCRRILVLDGGRIIESGTYDELMAQNGVFADLVARQTMDDQPRRPCGAPQPTQEERR